MAALHQPVLVDEVVHWLVPREGAGATIVDGTVGGGGHAVALARRIGLSGRVIGLDRDPAMLALRETVNAVSRAQGYALPVTLVHAAYREMRLVLDEIGLNQVEGVLLDLGLSSDQLAAADRGFSFALDGPLDMRFDPSEHGPTAADLVQRLPEAELAQLFFDFGEERFSRRISRRIVEARRKSPSGQPASWPSWCDAVSRQRRGTDRSTPPPVYSRRCGSQSIVSWKSSTPCWK